MSKECSSVVYFRRWLRCVKWKAWSYSVRLVSGTICYEVTKNIILEGKSDFRCCREVVVRVLMWL